MLLVLLAGCAGFSVTDDGTPTSGATPTATATATAEPTPTEPWTSPEPPNRPTDVEESDRIKSFELVNESRASDGTGYSDFDVLVRADTRMADVDPPDHGTRRGEPYFLVSVNDELVSRTGIVVEEANRSFHIRVKRAALSQFDPGELEVRVSLMDEDSQSDDQYATATATIEYDPD